VKTVKFSDHAEEKMRIRNIKAFDVYATLRMPDQLFEDLEHGTMVGVKKANGNSIIVAYRLEVDVAKVITLFYTSKLDKLVRSKMVRGAWKKVK
jgi:hypothetical protein